MATASEFMGLQSSSKGAPQPCKRTKARSCIASSSTSLQTCGYTVSLSFHIEEYKNHASNVVRTVIIAMDHLPMFAREARQSQNEADPASSNPRSKKR